MRLILTQDVPHLGSIGELVNVKNGYARNYLIPRSLATFATESNQKELEHQKRVLARKKEKMIASFKDLARKIESLSLELVKQTGEEERIFGSVTSAEVASELMGKEVEISKKNISFPEEIKKTGTYYADIKLHSEVSAKLKIIVKAP